LPIDFGIGRIPFRQLDPENIMQNGTQFFSRRQMLQSLSSGFGFLAFSSLSTLAAAQESNHSGNPLAPRDGHFPAKAKRVIFLCMRGGPSHLDTFDHKPELKKLDGKSGKFRGTLMKSPWEFKKQNSGLWISELLPEIGRMSDELCLLRGMHTDQPVHSSSMTRLHTGNSQFVRPSLGAWTLYGLGTENDSLPGFVSLSPAAGSAQNYGSAFLPAIYSGTSLGRSTRGARPSRGNDQIPDIKNPHLTSSQQRQQLNFIQQLNKQKLVHDISQPGVEGVIESYELAFRMQSALPDLMDLSQEDTETQELYGIGGTSPSSNFGRQCLLARRFVEAGVRFVEIEHASWDTHFNMSNQLPNLCSQIDKPIAGLLADLKRRDMLKDTLVLWAGEFGRTPFAQNGDGRDHNNKGFTTWMAGGGVKGGFSYGGTDETGGEAVEGKCHIHDWHATILHLLGLDHTQLTYRYAGRDFRLTDVHGNVLDDIIA
jgi:Protein of unknown function (DUF1501)